MGNMDEACCQLDVSGDNCYASPGQPRIFWSKTAYATSVQAAPEGPVFEMIEEHTFNGSDDVAMGILTAEGEAADLPLGGSPYTIEAMVLPEPKHKKWVHSIVGWGAYSDNALNRLFINQENSLGNDWWNNGSMAPCGNTLMNGSFHHV